MMSQSHNGNLPNTHKTQPKLQMSDLKSQPELCNNTQSFEHASHTRETLAWMASGDM